MRGALGASELFYLHYVFQFGGSDEIIFHPNLYDYYYHYFFFSLFLQRKKKKKDHVMRKVKLPLVYEIGQVRKYTYLYYL